MQNSKSLAAVSQQSAVMAQLQPILDELPRADDDLTPRMMQAILDSPEELDLEQFFANTLKGAEAVGFSYRFLDLRWRPSDYDEGLPIYLLCDVIDLATGATDVMSIGAATAVAQLLAAWKRGELPKDYAIMQGNKTKAGFTPIQLRALPRDVTEEG